MLFASVVLSGGGIKGLATLGALHYHFTRGHLVACKMWVGVSVGGLIAALMVAGYSPEELYNVIKNPEDLLGDHDARKVMVESLLQKRGFSPTVTLRDFAAATKKTLILVATSLNRGGPVYLSHMTAPDTTVVDAACATSAIPLYFPPVSFDGDTFVDGCISDPYPVDIACITRPTLGIRIKDSAHPGMCGASVLGVGSRIVGIMMKILLSGDRRWAVSYGMEIVLDIEGISPVDMTLDRRTRERLVRYGYLQSKDVDSLFFSQTHKRSKSC